MSASAASSPALPLPRPGSGSEVPHFTINLSLPPAERWAEIVRLYAPYWAGMAEHMREEFDRADEAEAAEMEAEAEEAAAQAKSASKRAKSGASGKQKRQAAAAEAAAAAAAAKAARMAARAEFSAEVTASLLAAFRKEGASVAEYAEELEAVSKASGVSVEDLVMLNLSYESHGGCTSIVLPLSDGSLMLGRTLDWQQPLLRQLTVDLTFVRGGKVLYRATSFAGFLAIFTGHVPGGYAVAVNFRGSEQVDEEEEEEDEDEDSMPDRDQPYPFEWPVGYLVRHTLESCSSYSSAVLSLSQAPLMSPAYFTVMGVRGDDALIITRDSQGSVKPVQLCSMGGDGAAAAGAGSDASLRALPLPAPSPSPWLCQANMDHWLTAKRLDLQQSLPRTRLVNQQLQAERRTPADERATEKRMWQLLSLPVLWDEETIYATVSVPASDRYTTLVECPHPQEAGGKKQGRGARGSGRRRRA